jgi:hypothetical protein
MAYFFRSLVALDAVSVKQEPDRALIGANLFAVGGHQPLERRGFFHLKVNFVSVLRLHLQVQVGDLGLGVLHNVATVLLPPSHGRKCSKIEKVQPVEANGKEAGERPGEKGERKRKGRRNTFASDILFLARPGRLSGSPFLAAFFFSGEIRAFLRRKTLPSRLFVRQNKQGAGPGHMALSSLPLSYFILLNLTLLFLNTLDV